MSRMQKLLDIHSLKVKFYTLAARVGKHFEMAAIRQSFHKFLASILLGKHGKYDSNLERLALPASADTDKELIHLLNLRTNEVHHD